MNIALIGTGNVAFVLGQALVDASHNVVQVLGRTKETTSILAEQLESLPFEIGATIDKLVDIVIIAISDDHIGDVSKTLVLEKKATIIVHTSGSIPLYAIEDSFRNRGVFYPLQTFKKGKNLNFQEVPLCLNAVDRPTLKTIRILAESLTKQIYILSDDERKKAHVAAVVVNNFTNHLVTSAYDYLSTESLPIQLIQPLLKETMVKLLQIPPDTNQTGPAKRNDTETITQHLKMLEGHPIHDLYQAMTNSIIQKHIL